MEKKLSLEKLEKVCVSGNCIQGMESCAFHSPSVLVC